MLGTLFDTGSGTSRRYTHNQVTPATVWTISHGFGMTPFSVRVLNTDGEEVGALVESIDNNTTQITFGGPFSGEAYLGA